MTDDDLARRLLGSDFFETWDTAERDQKKGLPPPPLQTPIPPGSLLIDLPSPEAFSFHQVSLLQALRNRQSRRKYVPNPLSLSELAFLCWATQGVRQVDLQNMWLKRTVPSAGARQPFESYLGVMRVEGLDAGLYRYLSLEHQLCQLKLDPAISEQIGNLCGDFAGSSAVTFIWTAIPYRTAWRYSDVAAKFILQDSGHVCQNLYLAVEAIGAGACAVSGYAQKALDAYLGLDGQSELTVYCATVGKVP